MARHASWHLSVLPLLDALSATGATDLPPDDGAEGGHWRDLPATTREPDDCPQNATLPGAECPLPAPHRAPRVSRPGRLTLPDRRLGGHPTRLPTPTLLVRHTLSSFGALSHEQATSAPSRRQLSYSLTRWSRSRVKRFARLTRTAVAGPFLAPPFVGTGPGPGGIRDGPRAAAVWTVRYAFPLHALLPTSTTCRQGAAEAFPSMGPPRRTLGRLQLQRRGTRASLGLRDGSAVLREYCRAQFSHAVRGERARVRWSTAALRQVVSCPLHSGSSAVLPWWDTSGMPRTALWTAHAHRYISKYKQVTVCVFVVGALFVGAPGSLGRTVRASRQTGACIGHFPSHTRAQVRAQVGPTIQQLRVAGLLWHGRRTAENR